MAIVSKKEDIVRWYEGVIYSSGIASPGLVKGTIFIHPRGWSIWEKIQSFMNSRYSKMGIGNVAFPSLVPVSEIEKEKSKLTGFIPELYLVSRSTDSPESRSVFLRPTSEILFSHYFRRNLSSHDQLPILLNQWCNVYRSEKNTKTFLRSCEFHWQEAHTLHETEGEALEYLEMFNGVYVDLVTNLLNIAVLRGEKTVNERFQGALKTLTLEAVMPDGQALQIATSHHLGRNFSEMFDVKYTNRNNVQEHPHQLSAGSSTRLLGALILSHSDDGGLVLPLGLADVQVMFLVLDNAVEEGSPVCDELSSLVSGLTRGWDFSKKSFGYKMKESELTGIPFVVVLGKREMESGRFLVKCRIDPEKKHLSRDELKEYFSTAGEWYSKSLYESSRRNLEQSIVEAHTLEDVKREVLENGRIVLAPWFDDEDNEIKFKGENLGFGPRCIESRISGGEASCFYSGKRATAYVYFGRSY